MTSLLLLLYIPTYTIRVSREPTEICSECFILRCLILLEKKNDVYIHRIEHRSLVDVSTLCAIRTFKWEQDIF